MNELLPLVVVPDGGGKRKYVHVQLNRGDGPPSNVVQTRALFWCSRIAKLTKLAVSSWATALLLAMEHDLVVDQASLLNVNY